MFASVMYGASAFVSLLYNRDDSKDDDNPQLVLFYTAWINLITPSITVNVRLNEYQNRKYFMNAGSKIVTGAPFKI